MTRRRWLAAFALATLVLARPAWAPFHLMVIDQLFFGLAGLPGAHYVQLRTLAIGQVSVQGQSFQLQNADGSSAPSFGAFDFSIDLPNFDADVPVLAGTREARDLFCVALDQVVTGRLPFPSGRVCFAGAVDCVAYGDFAGSTGGRGEPAVGAERGRALRRVDQTNVNLADFQLGEAEPENNRGEVGAIQGMVGDSDASGQVDSADIAAEVELLFEAGMRCEVEDPDRRGADANLDTRIGAADVTQTIRAMSGASA
jgi:hypothetical protein